MATYNPPYDAWKAGYPSQSSDIINDVLEGLIVGETPTVVTQDMVLAPNQVFDKPFTPVGFNASNQLVPAVAASLELTFSGTGTANDTVTIGGVVYKLVAVPADPNDIDIGADAATSAANLAAAINGAAGAGTLYGTGTVPNPHVTASVADAVVTLTAKQPGAAGNAVAVAESGTGTSFAGGATALAGGIGAIGLTLYPITVAANQTPGVPILRAACVAKHMVNWPASFTTDAQKLNAFAGAPTPTNIVVREAYYGSTVPAP